MLVRLAWRNVWRNGRRALIVLVATAVGLAGVILTISVNYGMVAQMVETAISTELGHLQVRPVGSDEDGSLSRRLEDGGARALEVLGELPQVRAFAPRLRSEGLASSPRASAGVRLLGIAPESEARVTRLAASITQGVYLDGEPRRILLGEELAERLHVALGDKVVLSATDAQGDLAGEAFRVAGLFRTPSLELDRTTVYLRLPEAQQLLAVGPAVSEVAIVAEARSAIPALRQALAARLGPTVEVRTWEELAPLLVYMVDVFEQMSWVIYAAVFVAMAFGIANVLLMAVFERTRELGVMRAVGMSARRVVVMIVLESVLLTAVGVLVGFGLAVLGVFSLRDGIDLSRFAEGLTSMGIGTTLVPVLRRSDFTTPAVVALATALLAGIWPALRAARAQPAEALRQI